MAVRKVVCVEIGLFITRVCYMEYGHKQNRILKYFVFQTPENTVEDAYIRDRETFSGVLKEELKKEKISCKDFVFTISSNKILSREVVIPFMKDKLIKGVIESERKEYFPMDISEHLLTYTVLEHMKEENQLRLMVYAAPTNLIKNYQHLAEAVGVRLVALDYVGNSVYQWMKRRPENSIDYFLLINEQSSMFSIMDKGSLSLQRNMNFGTESMVDVLLQSRKDEDLTWLRAFDCVVRGEYDEHEKERLEESIKSLAGNVSRVLEFYTAKNKTATIDKLIVMGKGEEVNYVVELLQEDLGIPVEGQLELPDVQVDYGKCHGGYIACIGASYPSVNFLNALTEVKEREVVSMGFCIALLVLAVVGCVALFLTGKLNYDNALEEQKNLKTQIENMSDIEVIYNEYLETEAFLGEIALMHLSTYNPNEALLGLITELENKLPSNIMIKSFSSSETGISMSLSASSKEEAAKTLLQLRTIDIFRQVSTGGIVDHIDPATGIQEVTFNVTCSYKLMLQAEE